MRASRVRLVQSNRSEESSLTTAAPGDGQELGHRSETNPIRQRDYPVERRPNDVQPSSDRAVGSGGAWGGRAGLLRTRGSVPCASPERPVADSSHCFRCLEKQSVAIASARPLRDYGESFLS